MISINEDITLKVRMMTNEVIIIKINILKTILEIKQEIRRIKNISVVNQKLIFQGKVLKDSDKITTYKLDDNDVINLIISQPNNNNNINSSRENR
jgi:ubiquilin